MRRTPCANISLLVMTEGQRRNRPETEITGADEWLRAQKTIISHFGKKFSPTHVDPTHNMVKPYRWVWPREYSVGRGVRLAAGTWFSLCRKNFFFSFVFSRFCRWMWRYGRLVRRMWRISRRHCRPWTSWWTLCNRATGNSPWRRHRPHRPRPLYGSPQRDGHSQPVNTIAKTFDFESSLVFLTKHRPADVVFADTTMFENETYFAGGPFLEDHFWRLKKGKNV